MPAIRNGTSGSAPDVLVDTDLFVDHLRGAAELRPGRHRAHYSVITQAELFAGSSATAQISLLLAPFRELAVDRAVAERAGRIKRRAGCACPTPSSPQPRYSTA
jgi:predicted nucleic acid-binding protein